MSKGKFVRCICTTRDGSRCGRMAPPDTQICAVHARPSGIVQAVERTPEEILKKLMTDSDPAIRLRAVNTYLDRVAKQEKGCEQCAARLARETAIEDLVARSTQAQRDQLRALCSQVKALKAVILTQPVQQESDHADVHEHSEPAGTTAAEPAAPDQHAAHRAAASATSVAESSTDDGVDDDGE